MAACISAPRTRAEEDRIGRAVARLDDLFHAPLTRADKHRACHRPADGKFMADSASFGTTWLLRHGRRDFARGRLAGGCARFVGVPFAGALAALGCVPLGLGVCLGRAAAERRMQRGLKRSEDGMRQDRIIAAVRDLDDALSRYAPICDGPAAMRASDDTYMRIAGDARQVLWDMDFNLRDNRAAYPRLAASGQIRKPLRHAMRMADRLDDNRRRRSK